jgi:hypothetical protein
VCDSPLAKPGACTLLRWGKAAGKWWQTSYFCVAALDPQLALHMIWTATSSRLGHSQSLRVTSCWRGVERVPCSHAMMGQGVRLMVAERL